MTQPERFLHERVVICAWLVCLVRGHVEEELPPFVSFGDHVRVVICARCRRYLGEIVAASEEE